jgi:hypothetical protein
VQYGAVVVRNMHDSCTDKSYSLYILAIDNETSSFVSRVHRLSYIVL